MLRACLATASAALFCLTIVVSAAGDDTANPPAYDLTPASRDGDATEVAVTLEVGGELLVPIQGGEDKRLPLSVAAQLAYAEQLLHWPAASGEPARSLRRYSKADATIKTDATSVQRELPAERNVVIAELARDGFAMTTLDAPLTRDQFDLLNVVANTLALDRLLPGKSVSEGDGWDHGMDVIAELLDMDHIAICDVRSIVTGMENRQVQIRLAGTAHGSVDGAATEMEVRGAYLFHLDRGRITKFNLAVKERRKPGEAAPGVDVVAKVSLTAMPIAQDKLPLFEPATIEQAAAMPREQLRQLLVDAPARGYRFRQDQAWFITAEQRELMSLRLVDEGEYLAHCNVVSSPARPAEQPPLLADFEKEVCQALGDKVGKVAAATEWTTPTGLRCLGVLIDGTVNEVAVQWRYYRLSAPGMPQATVSVTVEQSVLERFANADRPLVDSLELLGEPKTAAIELTNPAATK
jgi:hypothetical protein